jgi:hypothetical protein
MEAYSQPSHVSCAVAPDKMPWGTHAYILSSRQAERMALTADMMIARSRHPVDDFHTTSWQLDGEDLKIDHYLSMYYTDLTPQDDKRRWALLFWESAIHVNKACACFLSCHATSPF